MNFLIFGRPRSRTAWAANFLTYGDSFCFHEGLADSLGSWIDLKRRMDSFRSGTHVGNADTGMIHDVEGALETFPDAWYVVLTGNELSWRTFAQERELPDEFVEQVDMDYEHTKKVLRESPRAVFLDANEITSQEAYARLLWRHCTRQAYSFTPSRFHMLKDLNVQVIPESLERRLNLR